MKQTADEFRLGTLLDHEHTMKLLFLATEKNVSPYELCQSMIDIFWSFSEMKRGLNDK
jgi:hypothetical protein